MRRLTKTAAFYRGKVQNADGFVRIAVHWSSSLSWVQISAQVCLSSTVRSAFTASRSAPRAGTTGGGRRWPGLSGSTAGDTVAAREAETKHIINKADCGARAFPMGRRKHSPGLESRCPRSGTVLSGSGLSSAKGTTGTQRPASLKLLPRGGTWPPGGRRRRQELDLPDRERAAPRQAAV